MKTTLFFLILLSGFATAVEKPNILLINVDDLGYTDLACQGSGYYETPNVDKLKSQSLTFTNGYAGCANCAPSRAILMSGLHAGRHKLYTVPPATRGKAKDRKLIPIKTVSDLAPKFKTLPQTLKEAGYTTVHAGKWHLSDDPLTYGFDTNIGGLHAGHPKTYFSPYKNKNLTDGPKGEYLTTRLGNEMASWISKNKDKTIFAYMAFYSVHTPIQAPQDATDYFKTKKTTASHHNPKYAAMVQKMDAAVGHILDTLDKENLTEKTIVIFTSDNGPHGPTSSATPLRGTKGMFYEGGIRVPFFVKYPGVTKAGSSTDHPVAQIDLYPTLSKIAKATPPTQLDGNDISTLLAGKESPAHDLFWHFPCYLVSYGKSGMAGAKYPKWRATPCSVIRSGDFKLIQYFEDNTTELFNLKSDPSETTDISKTNPEKNTELLNKLKAWQEASGADIPTQPNPVYKDSSN